MYVSYFYFNLTTTIILKHSILHDNTRFYKYRHNCLRFIFIIQLQFSIKEFCLRAFSSIYHLLPYVLNILNSVYTSFVFLCYHFIANNQLLIIIIIFSHVSAFFNYFSQKYSPNIKNYTRVNFNALPKIFKFIFSCVTFRTSLIN